MKFQKGMPRLPNAGRKKGSKNKIKKVADYLSERGINPIQKMIDLIENGEMDDRDRLKGWSDVQSYCEAKPKSVEGEDPEDDELIDSLTDEQLLRLVKSDEVV